MIAITFLEPTNDRLWNRWRRDCIKATGAILAALAKRQSPKIPNLYKRDSIKDTFYFHRNCVFRGKCAYCETYLTQFQNPDIEHYRPKLGVTDENDVPIQVDYGWGNVPHLGYAWLALDWRNLLPSCQMCNQASSIETEKIGKHNRFPVVGPYAKSEKELADERPLLLNPVQEDPSPHLSVSTEDGTMVARDGSPRGAMTIRVLGLNTRDQLVQRRRDAMRAVKAQIAELVFSPTKRELILAELRDARDGKGEYTAAVRAQLDELAPVLSAALG